VRFGKPLDFSRYQGLESDRFILRSATDEIMYEIMRLGGQEYVDMYATRAKALDKEAAREAARETAKASAEQDAAKAGAGEGADERKAS
jgi:1-acyl-sn-glycerol-3-phosphate acyltransferase